MTDDPWPFYKFIGAQKEIYPEHRKLQHERRKESKRYCIDPHIDRITDQTEFRIASCTENPAISAVFTADPMI